MFNRLKQKWKVSWLQLILIFITFALGGSCCGYLGRQFISLFSIDSLWLRVPLYIVIVTLLWPICVLTISLPLGQFPFFKKFLGRLGRRLMGKQSIEE